MRWSHGWGLVGQILAIWISVSFIASPFIGRFLHARRTKREFEARKKRLSHRLMTADAIVAFESDWQQNARRAEALGFLDPEDTPKLAS